MIAKETCQTDEIGSIEWLDGGRDIPNVDFLL
jgi:hypothetical protein